MATGSERVSNNHWVAKEFSQECLYKRKNEKIKHPSPNCYITIMKIECTDYKHFANTAIYVHDHNLLLNGKKTGCIKTHIE